MRIDAATLYSLFCSRATKEKQIDAFDHANVLIPSRQRAIQRKDAMFGSFFDLQQILTVSESYGLTFDHYMIILPGIKTMRLVGHLNNYPPSNSCTQIDNDKKQEAQTTLSTQLSSSSTEKVHTNQPKTLAPQGVETVLIK